MISGTFPTGLQRDTHRNNVGHDDIYKKEKLSLCIWIWDGDLIFWADKEHLEKLCMADGHSKIIIVATGENPDIAVI